MGPLFCALCFVLCVSVCSVAGPVLCVRLLCVRLARRGVRALCAKCLFLLHSNNRSMSVFPRPHAVWDIGDLFEGQSNHLKGGGIAAFLAGSYSSLKSSFSAASFRTTQRLWENFPCRSKYRNGTERAYAQAPGVQNGTEQ